MENVILAGVDGSGTGTDALDWAINEARSRSWPLRLVGAYSPHRTSGSLKAGGAALSEADIAGVLEAAAGRAEEAGVAATSHALPGDADTILLEQSRSVALVVVGTHGRGGFAGRLLGAVPYGLAAHSASPVVIVPPKAGRTAPDSLPARNTSKSLRAIEVSDYGPVARDGGNLKLDGHIVAGLDALGTENPAVWAAADAAQRHDKPLTLLSVSTLRAADDGWMLAGFDMDHYYRDFAEALHSAAGTISEHFPRLDIDWRLFEGKAAHILVQATDSADLVVLGTRGYGGFRGLLLGSVSQTVLHHGESPMMIVPALDAATSPHHWLTGR